MVQNSFSQKSFSQNSFSQSSSSQNTSSHMKIFKNSSGQETALSSHQSYSPGASAKTSTETVTKNQWKTSTRFNSLDVITSKTIKVTAQELLLNIIRKQSSRLKIKLLVIPTEQKVMQNIENQSVQTSATDSTKSKTWSGVKNQKTVLGTAIA